MSLNLFLIKPRIKIKSQNQDNLKPFFKFLPPYIKIIIYINTHLSSRITQADILCILQIDEKERIKRLKKRNKGNFDKIQKFINEKELNIQDLKYKIKIML